MGNQPLLIEDPSVAWALSEAVYLKDQSFPCAENLLSWLTKINLAYAYKDISHMSFTEPFHRQNETKLGRVKYI